MAAGKQHHLEYGGSPVGTEFPGSLQFKLVDRIPVITVSQDFDEKTARQIRYSLIATVGPERPFYQRYLHVVLDVRMIREWLPGSAEFVNALRERMVQIGGELYLVTAREVPVSADVSRYPTADAALAAAKEARAERRAKVLQLR